MASEEKAGAGDGAAPRPPSDAPSAEDTVKMMVSGGVAGAFAKTCTAPLARLTILYQVRAMGRCTQPSSPPPVQRPAQRRGG